MARLMGQTVMHLVTRCHSQVSLTLLVCDLTRVLVRAGCLEAAWRARCWTPPSSRSSAFESSPWIAPVPGRAATMLIAALPPSRASAPHSLWARSYPCQIPSLLTYKQAQSKAALLPDCQAMRCSGLMAKQALHRRPPDEATVCSCR